ncbi:MAG: type VI secretion system tip protein VgrG [Lewinellaceae bacterium]|nr:type VI secretion system tip protein VgrG [Lewinellaceae bacterium]
MPLGNFDSPLQSANSTDLTTFKVLVDGNALPAGTGIISLEIEKSINRIPSAFLLVDDGDPAGQTFQGSSSDHFVPGKKIEIKGGYHQDESTLFKGVITKQKIRVNTWGGSFLHIEAKDEAFKMTLDRKSRYFKEMSDGDLFDEIAGAYDGISVDFSPAGAPVRHPEITQYQISDWDFLILRTEKLGMYCIVEDGTLKISGLPLVQTPAFRIEYGRNLIALDMEMDARTQFQAVKASSWDEANQEIITGESDDVSTPDQGNIPGAELAQIGGSNYSLAHGGILTQQDLDTWAEAQMLKSRMSRIRGTVKFQGNKTAAPGTLAEFRGFGDRFNGLALITGIQHSLGRGDWRTTAQVGFNPQWHYEQYEIMAEPASGFASAIHGLQIGVVSQLQDDPEGRERILVRLPIVDKAEEGTWMRWASLDAGTERGFVFRPEIGDEVVVGFLNDDPNQGIVIGALHSSSRAAPIPASDDNHIKGLVTREKIKVTFNDELKSLQLETPNGNTLTLSDDDGGVTLADENGNKVVLNSDGIALESAKNITLKAQGDIKLEGTNIEQKANASFKAQGSAGAEINSSAITVIKGSLVQIN